MPFSTQLLEILGAMRLQIAPTAVDNLCRYYAMLYEAGAHINLTSIPAEDAALLSFADSLCALPYLPKHGAALDVGCGAGLPGLVLAIAQPALRFTLLDATRKKIDFIRDVIHALRLPNVASLQGRAELLGQDAAYRARYDVCTARAVAPLVTLSEYCLPFLRVGGRMLAFKGKSAAEELQAARPAVRRMGGDRASILPANLPGREHCIVQIDKTRPTPAAYPRKVGDAPRKKPLLE